MQKDENVAYIGEKISEDGDIIFKYGSEKQLYYLLTGNKTTNIDLVSKKDNAIMDMYSRAGVSQLLQELPLKKDNYATIVRLREGTNNRLMVRDKKNNLHKIRTDRDYCITSVNSKYVTLSNSKRTREKIDIPISKLNNYIALVQYTKLDD